jgi:hypothetical protein
MRNTLISILLIFICGCSNNVFGDQIKTYPFELEVGLEQDDNGYYILPMIDSFNGQVLHKFTVNTNNPTENQFVYWDCETQMEMHIMDGWTEDIDIVNHASYTGSDEHAHSMFGPFVEMTGDTVTIFVGYVDSIYDVEYTETFSVILQGAEGCY